MNKTKVDLNDNLILRSENIEYENDTLKNALDATKIEDVTSRLTFTNCTLLAGKVLKFGKIVFMQIKILPTTTGGWLQLITNLPDDLFPLSITDGGAPITGSSFWVYGLGKGTMNGEITEVSSRNICGFWILKN